MSVISILPLASKSCLYKSLMSSTHELKALCRPIATLGMCRRGKSVMASKSTSLTTAVSDDGVQRRIGDHHSNLWDDNFIQSLSSPYGASSYGERAERLIGEVKEIFNSLSRTDGELVSHVDDLLQHLSMVDNVERLGIDRHFQTEIKVSLDYVYSYWSEKGIGSGRDIVCTDLNTTALGFRILRLHGYTVFPDVFEHFKDQMGRIACSDNHTERQISSILNLFRASLIAFPGEKVMEEAEIFSATYLKEALQTIPVSSLSQEIQYVLQYRWHSNLPRLEARTYIDILQENTKNQMLDVNTKKVLELAKLEFNIFHSLQQNELKSVSRWWKESGFPDLNFIRHRHVEFYTLVSGIDMEPKHCTFRLSFVKMCHLITVLDDMYDTFGTIDELRLFTAAVKRWDPSTTECLPEYMKGVYTVLYETVNEMAQEAQKSQGRDTLSYVRQALEAYIGAYHKEAEWISSGYLPTFDEYFENGKVSSGHRIATLQPTFMLDIPFPHHVLQEIDFPSKFNDFACSILRLRGDTRCYQADRARGEEASCISCYMKDNPGSTQEDALNHINNMIEETIKKLNWELLKPDNNVPISSKKHAFDINRGLHHFYNYRDGYTVASNETKNLVIKTVLEPVPM
uniref:Carene synthase, chloroplastic n=1 Tax=Picea abies TaxID=3329 RepID=3CAR1_PICAB|nr:RecName: Full=Carene synthase, chloroplastic; Short=PaJF67; Short=PaTPS-3car; AltName: Full=(+)-car-3-ene synthase; AltName: Full=3-carene cyclase; Flags: Precursor [Picea abies]AAO73863.1 (+)-3-carene synthase [Picea abies]